VAAAAGLGAAAGLIRSAALAADVSGQGKYTGTPGCGSKITAPCPPCRNPRSSSTSGFTANISITDGLTRIDEAIAQAAADGQPALAITDLANLFGMVKFYTAARAARASSPSSAAMSGSARRRRTATPLRRACCCWRRIAPATCACANCSPPPIWRRAATVAPKSVAAS
jgi:hypothetical protein